MPKIIEAIYEDGVFKPLEKIELKEGERVKIRISNVVGRTRGIIKGCDMEKIIKEVENGSFL
ncbi:MAG: antitoxin family protein [Archaeoglobales archaeon]|nr:antitoxin family protein [Archaeoglobales archaeon]